MTDFKIGKRQILDVEEVGNERETNIGNCPQLSQRYWSFLRFDEKGEIT